MDFDRKIWFLARLVVEVRNQRARVGKCFMAKNATGAPDKVAAAARLCARAKTVSCLSLGVWLSGGVTASPLHLDKHQLVPIAISSGRKRYG